MCQQAWYLHALSGGDRSHPGDRFVPDVKSGTSHTFYAHEATSENMQDAAVLS